LNRFQWASYRLQKIAKGVELCRLGLVDILDALSQSDYRLSTMTTITDLSLEQLRKAIGIKEQIAQLENELNKMFGGGTTAPQKPKQGGMSAAARAKISAAAKARWAKINAAKKSPAPKASKAKPPMSAAAKAKLSALMKARWAKIKAAKGK
jgi:hypothetical protein